VASGLTLHVGTPKSGTTHLQSILSARRADLAQAGVCYPGASYLPDDGLNQQPAVYGLGARHIDWLDTGPEKYTELLDALASEVKATGERVLLSAEAMCSLDEDEIGGLLEVLGVAAADTDVVITARDLGRMIPSIWQQTIKGGATKGLDGFTMAVSRARQETSTTSFWRVYGVPGIVERWAGVVGLDHVSVVTVPAGGHSSPELWARFADAARLPAAVRNVGSTSPRADNVSLSAGQAEMLRAINEVLRDRGMPPGDQRVLRRRILHQWQGAAHPAAIPIRLSTAAQAPVRRWTQEDVQALRSRGVRVVGDLDDLLAQPTHDGDASWPKCTPAMAYDVLALIDMPSRRSRRERLRSLVRGRFKG
jgi:hypothetical protein